MALNWDKLSTTKNTFPPIVIIYGGEGLGKTTLASEFPSPFFVQTGKNEAPPEGVEMPTFGLSETFQDVMDQIEWMLEAEHDRLTLVLDTIDSLETLVHAETCARNGWSSISQGEFGVNKQETAKVWLEFINRIIDLKQVGFAVVMLAHAKVKTDPGVTTESYPRFRINAQFDSDANSLAHAADIIGFIHQRVTIAEEAGGFSKKNVKRRGESGGDRVMAFEERPGFVAKNRNNMPKTIQFRLGEGYAEIAKYTNPPHSRKPSASTTTEEKVNG